MKSYECVILFLASSLNVVFLINRLYFVSSLRFTAKLNRMCRDFPDGPLPPTHNAGPLPTSHHSGTLATIHEPALTRHNRPKPVTDTGARSGCWALCGFGHRCNDVRPSVWHHSGWPRCPGNPPGSARSSLLLPPPLVSTDHCTISAILPFPEGPSWDHTACSLFGFTSVTE